MTTYDVTVTREDDAWIADVEGLAGAHTFGRNLVTLAGNIQEVIGLVLDRPADERFDVRLRFEGVDADFLEAAQLGGERLELERREAELAGRVAELAGRLARSGWSVRDISGALRISPGRVSQIVGTRGSDFTIVNKSPAGVVVIQTKGVRRPTASAAAQVLGGTSRKARADA